MGEIAESLLNGEFDEWTGEYIGPPVGYPRSLDPDHYSNYKNKWNHPNYGKNPYNGVTMWIRSKYHIGRRSNPQEVVQSMITKYYTEVLSKTVPTKKPYGKIAHEISTNKETWIQFKNWVINTYINK